MLNALLLPMLFSMFGGTFIYLKRSELRPQGLLVMTLFQLVGAAGYTMQRTESVFALLCVHALVVLVLLTRHIQGPRPTPQTTSDQ